MKRRTMSTSRLILDNVVALASDWAKQGDSNDRYSITIELALSELVRDSMRRTAQQRTTLRPESILAKALEESFGQVEGEIRQTGIQINLVRYREQVRKKLKPVAAEIEKLGKSLLTSREKGRLAEKMVFATDPTLRTKSVRLAFAALRRACWFSQPGNPLRLTWMGCRKVARSAEIGIPMKFSSVILTSSWMMMGASTSRWRIPRKVWLLRSANSCTNSPDGFLAELFETTPCSLRCRCPNAYLFSSVSASVR